MTEADPEDGPRPDEVGDGGDHAAEGTGVSRAVRQEDPVRVKRQDLVGRRGGRHHGDGGQAREVADDGRLDPEIERHHPQRSRADGVGGSGRHGAGKVLAVGALGGGGGGGDGVVPPGAERTRHRSRVTQMAGEAPGIDAGDRTHPPCGEEVLECALRPPARVQGREVTDDDALEVRGRRLVIERGDPVVADVGVGERHDLAGIARVGDDLLVAAQRRVEDRLAGDDATVDQAPRRFAFEDGPVAQHQVCLWSPRHRWASNSLTTGAPRTIVWRTPPMRVRPA